MRCLDCKNEEVFTIASKVIEYTKVWLNGDEEEDSKSLDVEFLEDMGTWCYRCDSKNVVKS